jgi:hypothetical protein
MNRLIPISPGKAQAGCDGVGGLAGAQFGVVAEVQPEIVLEHGGGADARTAASRPGSVALT